MDASVPVLDGSVKKMGGETKKKEAAPASRCAIEKPKTGERQDMPPETTCRRVKCLAAGGRFRRRFIVLQGLEGEGTAGEGKVIILPSGLLGACATSA